jgi:hypothetical protein
LAAWFALGATGYADILELRDGREIHGTFEGGDARVIRFRSDAGLGDYDVLAVWRVRIAPPEPVAASAFGLSQERIIRAWFADRSRGQGLPPGLARRESLPPGLARQVRRNGTLPPGLERRLEPLPPDLEVRLPELVVGIARVILGRDVLLIDVRTDKILDVLQDVF